MKLYLTENIQFVITCLLWVSVGFIFPPINYALVPLTLILFYKRGFELDLLVGFLLVLIFSDIRSSAFAWAGQVKNIYIIILSLVLFKEYSQLNVKVKIHLFILPFILIASFCLIYSPDVFTAVQKTLSYFLLFFIVPNYFSYLYSKFNVEIIKNLIWAVFFILLFGIVLKYVSPDFTSLAGRFRGLLGNPNGLGIFCFLFICFFTIALEFFPDLFTRNEKILIYFFAFASLVFCGGRSSLIGLLMFLSFRYFNILSPILSFFIMIFTIASYEYISNNIESIVYALGIEEYFRVDTLKNGSGRLFAWNFAWEQIQKNYFFGRGFSYNEYVFKENYLYLLNLGHQGSSAHNAYLTFWLDTGLVGLTAFIVGIVSFIVKISKMSRSLFPLLFAVLFSNQFESWLTASLNPFTIMFLLSLSLIYVVSTNNSMLSGDEKVTSNDSDDLILSPNVA